MEIFQIPRPGHRRGGYQSSHNGSVVHSKIQGSFQQNIQRGKKSKILLSLKHHAAYRYNEMMKLDSRGEEDDKETVDCENIESLTKEFFLRCDVKLPPINNVEV